jgi:GH15 family glucan-1,4-alpha-glucosidase
VQPPIDDYALIGDGNTAALVSRRGSIDWLCWPNFDSPSCFAALLGAPEHGHWVIAPAERQASGRRHYRDATLVLETIFTTAEGEVALIDFMPHGAAHSCVVRLVEGRRGTVRMRMRLTPSFFYGATAPWIRHLEDGTGVRAIGGPDLVTLRTSTPVHVHEYTVSADFAVGAGETMPFSLTYTASHAPTPPPIDAHAALEATEIYWRGWSGRGHYEGRYKTAVQRSLLTLKALCHLPTGSMVAAPTTSLPESPGGTRNWDYRYCWLRDSALVIRPVLDAGHTAEALAWCEWLHRSIAGRPDDVHILYSITGRRRIPEWEAEWLPGYRGARPVRIGNAAAVQLQLDVFGEVLDTLHAAREAGAAADHIWPLAHGLVEHLETIWRHPDEGIWEVRGGPRHFTFSKVMAWVAFDRAIISAERFRLPAPLERWRRIRKTIHDEVCANGFDPQHNSFMQSFGGKEFDASVLLMDALGFLPSDDPRIRGTVRAIEQNLLTGEFVRRYDTEGPIDGLPPGEGAFLPCSFWLVDAYARQGQRKKAEALFERLLTLANDVGLLAEEYDPNTGHLVGNFPQGFSHAGLVSSALALDKAGVS